MHSKKAPLATLNKQFEELSVEMFRQLKLLVVRIDSVDKVLVGEGKAN